jgi:hypothetical protein
MVLMGERRAEQREDAVAGGLHDIAVVVTDRLDHQLQGWIYNRAGLLRIEFLHQLSGALDVGEQRGDRFALAFETFGGGFFNHPERSILRLFWEGTWRLPKRGGAFTAEVLTGLVRSTAART